MLGGVLGCYIQGDVTFKGALLFIYTVIIVYIRLTIRSMFDHQVCLYRELQSFFQLWMWQWRMHQLCL